MLIFLYNQKLTDINKMVMFAVFHGRMNMRTLLLRTTPTLVRGNRKEQFVALATLGIRFSLAGYIASSMLPIVDRMVTADLAGLHLALAAAAAIAVGSTFFKAI